LIGFVICELRAILVIRVQIAVVVSEFHINLRRFAISSGVHKVLHLNQADFPSFFDAVTEIAQLAESYGRFFVPLVLKGFTREIVLNARRGDKDHNYGKDRQKNRA